MSGQAFKLMSSSKRNGVTLVEALVVIGIIGLILGIAIPSLMTAGGLARNVECQNQMRQLLMDRLEGMNTPDLASISVCPADSLGSFREGNGHYSYFFDYSTGQPDFHKRVKNRSARVMVLFESADEFFGSNQKLQELYSCGPHGDWYYRLDETKQRFYATIALQRHRNQSANYGFQDGHVEQINYGFFERALERKEWCFNRNVDGSLDPYKKCRWHHEL